MTASFEARYTKTKKENVCPDVTQIIIAPDILILFSALYTRMNRVFNSSKLNFQILEVF